MSSLTLVPNATKHMHFYERLRTVKGKRSPFYKCMDPECPHYINANLLLGRRVLCSICKAGKLVVTSEDLKRKHFRCIDCSNTKEARAARNPTKKIHGLDLAVLLSRSEIEED